MDGSCFQATSLNKCSCILYLVFCILYLVSCTLYLAYKSLSDNGSCFRSIRSRQTTRCHSGAGSVRLTCQRTLCFSPTTRCSPRQTTTAAPPGVPPSRTRTAADGGGPGAGKYRYCDLSTFFEIKCYIIVKKIIKFYFILYYVMLYYVMLCYVMLCYVMLCYVMLCYVMLCYVMLCYVMLCYVMLCYAML